METYFGSKQPEFLPQDREIQDGDSGNHQDIPPTRGVGHLHRLQGCILPHPNTGTVQEISEISYPRANIPIQSLAIRTIDSTIGVHCSSKGGETDGHTQGYKDPPVPRRLVSASRIPPSLSPTHSGTGTDVPRVRLVGEFGQVGTGTQTNLRFCRLPVRSESRSTPDRWQNLQEKISEILSLPACPVRQFMSLIGLLTATEKQVHLDRLHMRPIQWHLKNNW